MQNLKKRFYTALCGLALVLLMAGCADILKGPDAPEAAKPGKATLTVGSGPARTITPSLSQFGKITLSFAGQKGAADLADVDASSGSATVEFPVGSWAVTAKAYLKAGDADPAAASEAHGFSWDGEDLTGEDRFILVPTGTGPGTLTYTVTVPQGVTLGGSGSRIQIEVGGAPLEDLDTDGFTDGAHTITVSEADKTVTLAAGRYRVDILLENGTGETAVFQESVVILPGLVTELRYEPAAAAFLDPAARAAMTDLTGLEFGATQNDAVGIVVDELAATADPFVYTLGIDAPAETNPVYFILNKTVEHRVAVGGTGAALVSLPAEAEGSIAGGELAVFAVNTASVLEEGGALSFTLTVGEDGKAPLEIGVTLTVGTPFIPLLWIDSAGEDEAEKLGLVPDQDSITNLQQALDWLETNAADNTKYVVKVSEDSELTDYFLLNKDIRVTLRGIGGERAIYTNTGITTPGASGYNALFSINKGTMTLDENITLDGRDVSSATLGGNLTQMVSVTDGALEMRAGSRITRVKGAAVRLFTEKNGAFRMYGGTIDYCTEGSYVVYVPVGSFEMYEGAKITNNTLYVSAHENTNTINNVYSGSVAAVSLTSLSTFTMYGGEISNTNYRGVYITGSTNALGTFIMKGGVIKNNGNSFITNTTNNQTFYPLGGGVLKDLAGIFYMEGGEISGNGVAGMPGSGIMIFNNKSAIPEGFVLNGAVTIADNTIGLRSNSGSTTNVVAQAVIGSAFSSTASTIAVDLCANTSGTAANFDNYWKGRPLLIPLNETNPIVIGSNLAALFTPVRCYLALSNALPVSFSELAYGIDSSGVVVNNASTGE
jgi:hypothetical protein